MTESSVVKDYDLNIFHEPSTFMILIFFHSKTIFGAITKTEPLQNSPNVCNSKVFLALV